MAPKGLESVDSTTYNWVPSHTATALWPVRPPVPNLGAPVRGREAKTRRRGAVGGGGMSLTHCMHR